MSVSDRFRALLDRIEPTSSELSAYQQHFETVRRCLESVYPDSKAQIIGSHSRGSGIRHKSDLDVMFRLPREVASRGGTRLSSNTVVKNVKHDLQDRFTMTAVDKDGEAITIGFRDGHYSVDIVPAVWVEMRPVGPNDANRPVFQIPDGDGGWIDTSPPAHNDFIAQANKASGGHLLNVARLIKFWRNCRSHDTPLSSFYVELTLAISGICTPGKPYADCVAETFAHLADVECRSVRDPLGISGLIQAAATSAKRDSVIRSVASSATHADRALFAERTRDAQEAYRQWDIVFHDKFPKA